MAEASQSWVSEPGDPEQRNENASSDPNSNDGSSGSIQDEDLQRAQILAHAKTVATPPATPSIPDEIEMDITSNDLSEHAPGLYVARGWIRPRNLTQQEIDRVMLRLEVDLTLALSKIRAKSHKKRWNEDRVMIDMRMAGTPARGSTKVTLRPCIWIFCGSKWCKKIVERDVKALNWLGAHKVHVVRKGGPVLAADEELSAGDLDQSKTGHCSPAESLSDEHGQHNPEQVAPSSDKPSAESSSQERPPFTHNYPATPAQSSRAPTQTHSATYGGDANHKSRVESAVTFNYGNYPGYDVASVVSSSVPSYSSGGSVGGWSDGRSYRTTASSVSALSKSIHPTHARSAITRQAAPIQVYRLPCELRYLTGCDVIFPGDDEQGWMDHIEHHFGSRFPSKLRCWFCNDHYFDARQTSGGDLRHNFTLRMRHIRQHLLNEGLGFSPDQMLKDGHVVQYLFDQKLIDSSTYNSILSPATLPPLPHTQGGPKTHRSQRQVQRVGEAQATHSSFNGPGFNTPLNQYLRPRLRSQRYNSSEVQLPGSPLGSIELRLHVRTHGLTSLIGLTCISTTWRERIELSRGISKLGGAISVKVDGHTKLYGVTAGHGLVHQLLSTSSERAGFDSGIVAG